MMLRIAVVQSDAEIGKYFALFCQNFLKFEGGHELENFVSN
jgi:hypothetical protein